MVIHLLVANNRFLPAIFNSISTKTLDVRIPRIVETAIAMSILMYGNLGILDYILKIIPPRIALAICELGRGGLFLDSPSN